MDQAQEQLSFIRREPDLSIRKSLYGRFLIDACREQNSNKIRVMWDLLWQPFGSIVDTMIGLMNVSIHSASNSGVSEPESYRSYLVELDNAYDEAAELEDLQLKDDMVDMD